ncbi:hypothetical protein [Cognatilysobacter terrigena]|uniref:hypothetical protein n=1 Tax=Cognatilysobacter terrigena TaxID=2488749 RepID=UPI00105C112F|nr:hypothetical protein [Lysobacter terrigena]
MLDISMVDGGIAVLAGRGDASIGAMRGAVRDAMVDVQLAGRRRIVVDMSEATGLGHPGVMQRIDTVREWAAIAVPGLSLAFVAHHAFLDEDRIGMIVASQLGLNAHAFSCRDEAIAWLRKQRLFNAQRVETVATLAEAQQG